jgi:hypothetical protein
VTAGAWKSPLGLIVPAVADQLTPVLAEFWTTALNCRLPPDEMLASAGDNRMRAEDCGAGVEGAPGCTPLQAIVAARKVRIIPTDKKRTEIRILSLSHGRRSFRFDIAIFLETKLGD